MSIQSKVFDVAKAARFVFEHINTGRILVLPFGGAPTLDRGVAEEEITAQDDDGNITVVATVTTEKRPKLEIPISVFTPEVLEMVEGVLMTPDTRAITYGFLGTVPANGEVPEQIGDSIFAGALADTATISIKNDDNQTIALQREDFSASGAVTANRFQSGPNGRLRFPIDLAGTPYGGTVVIPGVEQLILSDTAVGEYRIYGLILTNEGDTYTFRANRAKPEAGMNLNFGERERVVMLRLFPELGSCRTYTYAKTNRRIRCIDLLAS